MNANASTTQTDETTEKSMPTYMLFIRLAIVALLMAALLFIPAGTLNWVMAWAYIGVYVVGATIAALIAFRKHPDLIDERAHAPQDAKGWDKVLSTFLILLTLFVPLPVAGLDVRFGGTSQLPLALQLVALGIYPLGYALGLWAAISNKFYSRVVRIQTDRGHTVASGGPYRFVRHPGYVGAALDALTMPLILGSLWALVPTVLAMIGLVVRTALEDKTLHEELPGYAEYARQTRFRLVPGIW
jgi:protein-S-isoprenylcysteine O-methyltransferase Ste14